MRARRTARLLELAPVVSSRAVIARQPGQYHDGCSRRRGHGRLPVAQRARARRRAVRHPVRVDDRGREQHLRVRREVRG